MRAPRRGGSDAFPATTPDNLDGLDYLGGASLDEINWKAYEGTETAHLAGGVPCTSFEIESPDARDRRAG